MNNLLTFAPAVAYSLPTSVNHWPGFAARETGGYPPLSGFFMPVIHEMPFMGGSCGRVKALPVLSRSANPHVSAHPFCSGRAEYINRFDRSHT